MVPLQREQGLPSHVITVSGRSRQDIDNGVAVAKKVVQYLGTQSTGQAHRRMAAAFKIAPTMTVELVFWPGDPLKDLTKARLALIKV